MLSLGEKQTLIIDRDTEPGLFLRNEQGDEVLLPNKYKPDTFELGDSLEVFVYLDHEERPVATNLDPFVKLDEFGYLKCVEVSDLGAFMDWGLEKHLFVPFREQISRMKQGYHYLIFCYLDEMTDRLVGSSKVDSFLSNSELTVSPFEEVELIISNQTDLGWNVIINSLHKGLLFEGDVFQTLQTGDRITGFIKKIRPDGKIDVVLQRPGYRSIEPNTEELLAQLKINGGFLKLTDKSSPDDIKEQLGMSKKSFKRAVGTLYKQRAVDIQENGIRLIKSEK